MNFVALVLNSSILYGGRLIRLSVNLPGSMVETKWCIAISGFRLRMLIQTLENLSMKSRKDSPLSCLTLRRDMEDVRWGLLVAYCVVNFNSKASKFAMELGGRS